MAEVQAYRDLIEREQQKICKVGEPCEFLEEAEAMFAQVAVAYLRLLAKCPPGQHQGCGLNVPANAQEASRMLTLLRLPAFASGGPGAPAIPANLAQGVADLIERTRKYGMPEEAIVALLALAHTASQDLILTEQKVRDLAKRGSFPEGIATKAADIIQKSQGSAQSLVDTLAALPPPERLQILRLYHRIALDGRQRPPEPMVQLVVNCPSCTVNQLHPDPLVSKAARNFLYGIEEVLTSTTDQSLAEPKVVHGEDELKKVQAACRAGQARCEAVIVLSFEYTQSAANVTATGYLWFPRPSEPPRRETVEFPLHQGTNTCSTAVVNVQAAAAHRMMKELAHQYGTLADIPSLDERPSSVIAPITHCGVTIFESSPGGGPDIDRLDQVRKLYLDNQGCDAQLGKGIVETLTKRGFELASARVPGSLQLSLSPAELDPATHCTATLRFEDQPDRTFVLATAFGPGLERAAGEDIATRVSIHWWLATTARRPPSPTPPDSVVETVVEKVKKEPAPAKSPAWLTPLAPGSQLIDDNQQGVRAIGYTWLVLDTAALVGTVAFGLMAIRERNEAAGTDGDLGTANNYLAASAASGAVLGASRVASLYWVFE